MVWFVNTTSVVGEGDRYTDEADARKAAFRLAVSSADGVAFLVPLRNGDAGCTFRRRYRDDGAVAVVLEPWRQRAGEQP